MNRILIVVAACILVLAGAWYWFTYQSPAPATSAIHPVLSSDLLPLYSKASWGSPENESIVLGTTSITGARITSTATDAGMDPSSIFTPFENYYDQKLKALGWSVANDLAAGGHTGGQTGYRKDSSIILTRFSIDYQNEPADAPSECPCAVTLSLFSSN